MSVTGVFTRECPTLPDGRRRHFMVKDERLSCFVCENCGHVTHPGQRWEQPRRGGLKKAR